MPLRIACLTLLGALACQASTGQPPRVQDAPAATSGAEDHLVRVGTLSLHLHCVGHGSPSVILEAGLELPGSDWRPVLQRLGQLTRTCAYDRAGTGYSSDAPAGRSPEAPLDDLHELLQTANIAAPYVLVGHSIGGLNVRRYASRFREQVAGMVPVDATPAQATPVPDPKTLADHDTNLAARLAELRASRASLGDLPLVVLSRGKAQELPGLPAELGTRFENEWGQMQGELALLSTNSQRSIAPEAGHFLHWDAPEHVQVAVESVLRAVRSNARVALPAALQAEPNIP